MGPRPVCIGLRQDATIPGRGVGHTGHPRAATQGPEAGDQSGAKARACAGFTKGHQWQTRRRMVAPAGTVAPAGRPAREG